MNLYGVQPNNLFHYIAKSSNYYQQTQNINRSKKNIPFLMKKNNLMVKTQLMVLLILLFLFISSTNLSIQETVISTTRNQHRAAICGYFSDEYTETQRERSKQTVKSYTYLPESQIQDILYNQNYFQTNIETLLMILPHVLGILVLFLAIPALFCCCMWPEKYPTCKKLRKPQEEMYKRCELKWPVYTTLLLYLVVVIASITSLFIGANFIDHFNNMGCRFVAIFDDTQNGRISPSVNGRFFAGLNPFRTEIDTFKTAKISTFFSDSSSALSTASDIRSKQTIIQNDLQAQYTSYNDISYSNAFSADGSTYFTVSSDFKSMYWGPTSDSSTILGNIKSKLTIIFDQVNNGLDNMITAWDGISTTTQAGVSSQITSTMAQIESINLALDKYMSKIGKTFNVSIQISQQPDNFSQIQILFQFIYGTVFALSLVGLLGAFLLACFTVVRSRLIIYFTCGGLAIFNLITFAMLIVFAYIHPNLSQTCAYIDVQLSSGSTTKAMFRNMGYGTFGNLLQQCMADGDGKLMDKISVPFSDSFDQINTIAKGTQLFNSIIVDYTAANLAAPITSATQKITKIQTAQLWDISDATAKTYVGKVVNKTFVPSGTCNLTAVSGDAWMPSFSLFNCPAGKLKKDQCSPLNNFAICPLGCYQIYNQFVSPSGDHDYAINLATRYSSSSCNYFQFIANLHDNWDIPRAAQMVSVQAIIDDIQTEIDDYQSQTNAVQASLSSFSTTLQSNMDSQTNLTSGTFNGVDCRVIGQSIEDFRDSMCIGLLQSITYNIICLGLMSYAGLLIAFCGTYTGVQHFKHLQKMQMNVGYKGVPISISDTRILDK